MTKVLFIDIETTGLDPERDLILEVGYIVYDLAAGKGIAEGAFLPASPERGNERFRAMDPYVYRMHIDNGLWQARGREKGFEPSCEEVEEEILCTLVRWGIHRGVCMAGGFSVGFDLAFLRRCMPRLVGFLSHRVIDASVLKSLSKAYGKSWPKKEPAHRALADCREAIRVVEHFRSAIESVGPMPDEEPHGPL